MFVVCLVTLWSFDLLEPHSEILVIDPSVVLTTFLASHDGELDNEQLAILSDQFNTIVMAEAAAIFNDTGSVIINKSHMLAGGRDVTNEFAEIVVSRQQAEADQSGVSP